MTSTGIRKVSLTTAYTRAIYPLTSHKRDLAGENSYPHRERVRTKLQDTGERLGITHSKHRPRIAGGGENLPLEILRSLSVWLSVLDERGVVPGGAFGGMLGCLQAFEDSLSSECFLGVR